jgi:hypothetical protein
MTTRADSLARRGLEHEAFEHARWTPPLAIPAPHRKPRHHLVADLARLLGFAALLVVTVAPWLRVLFIVLKDLQ